ncbi:MAG: glutamate--tRNA ligase [Nanoarchaeota archaeon]
MDAITRAIRNFALQNAIKYDGTANPKSIMGKILGTIPELRQDVPKTRAMIEDIVARVNELSVEDQRKELEEQAPEFLDQPKAKKREGPKELEDTKGKVVMRFAPSPSGPMHIGHALTGGLTAYYVDRYKGEFILRIEDTNSDNIYAPAYEMIPRDADWIFGNVSEVLIQSDRLEVYYRYAETLISGENAYICTCDPERFRELISAKTPCPCRGSGPEEHMRRWKKMFDKDSGYAQGEAVMRFRSEITHKNPAMRDFPLARINDSEHPRTGVKYRVWPLMNLSVTVDDIESGVTHIIRAKEHADNAKRQKLMYDALGKKEPHTYFTGRYKFNGLEISCSKTKKRIDEGQFTGWDDIRLAFLEPLRRRGYQPQAFIKYTTVTGLSKVDKVVDADEFFKGINAFNKEIIDPVSYRFFFVADPVHVDIAGMPEKQVELDLHPDTKKGGRLLRVSPSMLLAKQDLDRATEGKMHRLMDCANIERKGDSLVFSSESLEAFRANKGVIMHWLCTDDDLCDVELRMPDNTIRSGKGEATIRKLQVGDVVQFERVGFCRLDQIKEDGTYHFWFAHA